MVFCILEHFLFSFPGGEVVAYGQATVRPRAQSLAAVRGSRLPAFGLQNPIEASEDAWRQEEAIHKTGAASLQAPRPYYFNPLDRKI